MTKEIEIPSGYEARIDGNKVVFELKESNDDRIMKDIITTLSIGVACDESALHPGACTTLKEAIAYLEKQKEQKYYTYEQSKQAAEDCYYDKGYNTEDGGRCNQQSFLWGFEEGVDWCEQQKHQSAEYIKRNSKEWNTLLAEQYDKGFWKGKAEQKPAEWNWEDKEMIEDIIDLLDTNLAASDFHEIENWLNSLPERFNVQPKQEWSEEDEDMVLFWNMYYEHKVGDWPNKDIVEHLERFREWLNTRFKSLRPQLHLKPNGEQMAVLYDAISNLKHDNYKNIDVLESLYNYFEKL